MTGVRRALLAPDGRAASNRRGTAGGSIIQAAGSAEREGISRSDSVWSAMASGVGRASTPVGSGTVRPWAKSGAEPAVSQPSTTNENAERTLTALGSIWASWELQQRITAPHVRKEGLFYHK
jgi:hypothetical protein